MLYNKRGVKGEHCSPYIYELLRVFTICLRNIWSADLCRRNGGFGSSAATTQQRDQRRRKSNQHPSRARRDVGTGLSRGRVSNLASRSPIWVAVQTIESKTPSPDGPVGTAHVGTENADLFGQIHVKSGALQWMAVSVASNCRVRESMALNNNGYAVFFQWDDAIIYKLAKKIQKTRKKKQKIS